MDQTTPATSEVGSALGWQGIWDLTVSFHGKLEKIAPKTANINRIYNVLTHIMIPLDHITFSDQLEFLPTSKQNALKKEWIKFLSITKLDLSNEIESNLAMKTLDDFLSFIWSNGIAGYFSWSYSKNISETANKLDEHNTLFDKFTTYESQAATISARLESISETISKHLTSAEIMNRHLETETTISSSISKELLANQTTINSLIEKLSKELDKSTDNNNKYTSNLAILQEALGKAAGVSLFQTFGLRASELKISKQKWLNYIFLLVLASIFASVYIATNFSGFDKAFLLKLAISLPIIYAIIFCNTQYSHERHLEEVYAYKSNISLSLQAYKEFLDNVISPTVDTEREKHVDFIIQSISQIFTDPTNMQNNKPIANTAILTEALKPAAELLEVLKKIVK